LYEQEQEKNLLAPGSFGHLQLGAIAQFNELKRRANGLRRLLKTPLPGEVTKAFNPGLIEVEACFKELLIIL
jgi:hypothetical protein